MQHQQLFSSSFCLKRKSHKTMLILLLNEIEIFPSHKYIPTTTKSNYAQHYCNKTNHHQLNIENYTLLLDSYFHFSFLFFFQNISELSTLHTHYSCYTMGQTTIHIMYFTLFIHIQLTHQPLVYLPHNQTEI
jgi:hypothetical protein